MPALVLLPPPGEQAGRRARPRRRPALAAGPLARTGALSLPLVVAVTAGAAAAGDFLAHRTGALLGDRLLKVRPVGMDRWAALG
ncbi:MULTISPECIES: hypothetical protein [Streptomyces]|uniref:hypothetical protein n=1 Tax=Streptomyces TaxID=1883 RepID=UPI0018FEF9B5|nr:MULTISPECIES: hypothetical protein [Streptomyces]